MTGYGRSEKILSGRDILVEIRSVNHRYYEYSSRIPKPYGYIDDKLKTLLKNEISRGKVEICVSISNIEAKDTHIEINKAIAEEYISALRSVKYKFDLTDDLSLSKLIKLPDIFSVQKAPEDEEEIWNDVLEVAQEALSKFVEMRQIEGEKLRNDISEKADGILKMVEEIEKISPQTVENYRNRLYKKLSEILEDKNIDEQRIVTESALFAEKIAVDEETVRLRSHINQLKEMICSECAVGRKLDFLVQEMNREINTIGSKAQDLNVTRIVVDAKAEIEKIREQIQNIE